MGTGILAILTQTHVGATAGGHDAAIVAMLAGWVLAIVLTVGFGVRVLRSRTAWHDSMSGAAASQWGMVSMGILSIGSATATVLDPQSPLLAALAWRMDLVTWVVGTAIALVAALGFTRCLVLRDLGDPNATWGLALVAPMVSATTGATLSGRLDGSVAMAVLSIAVGCFFCSLTLGPVVFAIAYRHHWRVARLPLALTTSWWIPVGIIGQSTAAAQVIAERIPGLGSLAIGYGVIALGIGLPVVAWAVVTTLRGFRARMPYSPGWWALTFPLGTLSLGSHLLGETTGLVGLELVSILCWVTLIGTWTLCAGQSVRALAQAQTSRWAIAGSE